MGEQKRNVPASKPDALFDRIVKILEEARGNVVRAVNTGMVTAYWMIGREIVQEIQGGAERAEYGKEAIENLSKRLTERYGKGFSVTNLKYFRLFYQAYPDRSAGIRHPMGDELADSTKSSDPKTELVPVGIRYGAGSQLGGGCLPELSWSHYRALMRVNPSEESEYKADLQDAESQVLS